MVVTKEVTKQVAPDVTAQIFWLKNRNNKRWKDVKRQEITGKDGENLFPQPSLVEIASAKKALVAYNGGDNET